MSPRDTSRRERQDSYRTVSNDAPATHEPGSRGLSRREFLATAGIALVGGAGCVSDEDDAVDDRADDSPQNQADDSSDDPAGDEGDGQADDTGDDGTVTDPSPPKLRWIISPLRETVNPALQYRPLFEYLESELDAEHDVIHTADHTATVQEIRRDGGEFADVSPGGVVQTPEEIDVVGVRAAFGSELYFSLIATTQDSGIDELEDLHGMQVATAAPTSPSGTLFPLLMLSQAGLDTGGAPDGMPEDFTWRPSDHFTAREQLIQDPDIMAAGAGAFSLAPHIPQEQFDEMSPDFVDISVEYDGAGEREPNLNLLGVSDPIPRAPIVARADWDHPEREEIEQTLLDAPPEAFQHDEGRLVEELGAEDFDDPVVQDHLLWFDGLEPGSKDDYQPFVDLTRELGLEPEEI